MAPVEPPAPAPAPGPGPGPGFDPGWAGAFFGDDYLALYEDRLAPAATRAEAAFCARALGLRAGDAVLDLCCGTGRHSAALAAAGMRVVGLDVSAAYLGAARSGPGGAGCGWVRADMRAVPFRGRFDAVINMFTAFGYFADAASDRAAMAAAAGALRPGGALLIDTLSRDFAAAGSGTSERRTLAGGTVVTERRRFDPVEGRGHVSFEMRSPGGGVRRASHHIRLYAPTELGAMAEGAGLRVERWYGDYGGGELTARSRRTIMVARRPAGPGGGAGGPGPASGGAAGGGGAVRGRGGPGRRWGRGPGRAVRPGERVQGGAKRIDTGN